MRHGNVDGGFRPWFVRNGFFLGYGLTAEAPNNLKFWSCKYMIIIIETYFIGNPGCKTRLKYGEDWGYSRMTEISRP